jgi:hypothetical protein
LHSGDPALNRLTPDEFADALRKGKGRVVAHLRQFGDAGVEPELMAAYVSNCAYEEQIEDDRTAWLVGLLEYVGDRGRYRDAILQSLMRPGSEDVSHFAALAAVLARQGDEITRRAVYARFDTLEYACASYAATLIDLDGVGGLLLVARRFGRMVREDPALPLDVSSGRRASQRCRGGSSTGGSCE